MAGIPTEAEKVMEVIEKINQARDDGRVGRIQEAATELLSLLQKRSESGLDASLQLQLRDTCLYLLRHPNSDVSTNELSCTL